MVNVSARHMHLNQENLEILFGRGAQLTKLKDLYQAGEFASEQLVTIVGPRQRIIPNVRILGPLRNYTQVELSCTDGIYLGIDLPLRISGNHEGTPGCTVLGPSGAIHLNSGVIRAQRHAHMSTEDMAHYGVKDGDEMKFPLAEKYEIAAIPSTFLVGRDGKVIARDPSDEVLTKKLQELLKPGNPPHKAEK